MSRLNLQRITKASKFFEIDQAIRWNCGWYELKEFFFSFWKLKWSEFSVVATKDHTRCRRHRLQTDSAKESKENIQNRIKKTFGVFPETNHYVDHFCSNHNSYNNRLKLKPQVQSFRFHSPSNVNIFSFICHNEIEKKGIKQAKVNRWTVIHIRTWLSNFQNLFADSSLWNSHQAFSCTLSNQWNMIQYIFVRMTLW